MKKLFYLFLLLSFKSLAQPFTKYTGNILKATVINFSEINEPDYFPSLTNLQQHILPSSEYGILKQQLREKRNITDKISTTKLQKKRGLAINPTIFKAIQGNAPSGVPNDNDIAVSLDGKVISAVNSNLRFLDDTLKTLLNRSLTSLFSPLGNYSWISDPRLLYDPAADRFILTCFTGSLSTTNKILLAFSQTNDPSGTWNVYEINGNPFNDSTWSDYPIISVSDKDVFMTFNLVKDNVSWTIGFKQSVIWQIDKQRGYNGDTLQYTLWGNINYASNPLRNICPAKYQSSTMGANMYLLSVRNVAVSNDTVFLLEITNSHQSGLANLTMKPLVSNVAYGFPPNVPLVNGQELMTNDGRVLCAVYANDKVFFGSNSITTNNKASIYLGDVNNVSSNTPSVTGKIVDVDSVEYAYPSITHIGQSINDNKLLYTFSHCATNGFPGTSALYKNDIGDYSDVIRVYSGNTTVNILTDSMERWGDYSGIQKMYNNQNRAYLSGSYSLSGFYRTCVAILDNFDFALNNPSPIQNTATHLFPNPVQQFFTTQFYVKEKTTCTFPLYDVLGKKITTLLQADVKQGNNQFAFNVEKLTSGNYFLRISGKTIFYNFKIVKL